MTKRNEGKSQCSAGFQNTSGITKSKKPGTDTETPKAEGNGLQEDVSHALKKQCEHSSLSREVMCGQKSGEWICSACDETFTREEADVIWAKRKK